MTRSFTTTQAAMNAHWEAEDRIPMAHEQYVEALRVLNNRRSDGAATRADYTRIEALAGELARLHSDEAHYYTQLTASYADYGAAVTNSEGRTDE